MVPTGIITEDISGQVINLKKVISILCNNCNQSEHHSDAGFCHRCEEKLE
jgi:uncharacterized paraquat-inducible protein A